MLLPSQRAALHPRRCRCCGGGRERSAFMHGRRSPRPRPRARLVQVVQRQLSDAEKLDKNDDSPVTVADYGARCTAGVLAPSRPAGRARARSCSPARAPTPPHPTPHTHHTTPPPPAHAPGNRCPNDPAGAQAVVSYVLQQADPTTRLSMVAEEDSVSLTAPDGATMLRRITQLVNNVLASELGAQPLTEQQVVDLIGGAQPRSRAGCACLLRPSPCVERLHACHPAPLTSCQAPRHPQSPALARPPRRPGSVPGRPGGPALGARPHRRDPRLRGAAPIRRLPGHAAGGGGTPGGSGRGWAQAACAWPCCGWAAEPRAPLLPCSAACAVLCMLWRAAGWRGGAGGSGLPQPATDSRGERGWGRRYGDRPSDARGAWGAGRLSFDSRQQARVAAPAPAAAVHAWWPAPPPPGGNILAKPAAAACRRRRLRSQRRPGPGLPVPGAPGRGRLRRRPVGPGSAPAAHPC